MEKQLSSRTFDERKHSYDRVQEIIRENQPLIFLASPNILSGAKNTIGNFHPAILEPYVLWNVEQLYLRASSGSGRP
jgi:ABC-type transport system substrate-binding protein